MRTTWPRRRYGPLRVSSAALSWVNPMFTCRTAIGKPSWLSFVCVCVFLFPQGNAGTVTDSSPLPILTVLFAVCLALSSGHSTLRNVQR
jgi:hypothetical protein